MSTNNSSIGIFDSGIGGLTVVKEVMNQLPNENIIYFGDSARVPYGNKSPETVIAYTEQIVNFLLSKDVKAILIACNTVSAVALEVVRHKIPVPVIGVLKPGARTAAEVTRNRKIGVIATRATINSGLYEEFLHKTNPDTLVFGKACPLFVPLVEEGWFNSPITEQVAKEYLSDLLDCGIDSLILGCTHYPLLRDVIQRTVGDNVTLVNPAYEAARDLKYVLEENNILQPAESGKSPEHIFYVSDGADMFRNFANTILPCDMIETKDVNIKTFE